MKTDLHSEVISAARMILDSEGLFDVNITVKPGVFATHFRPIEGKWYIQFGGESIEAKLDLSTYPNRYTYLIYEYGKFFKYGSKHNTWLSATERIASVIIEEVAHAVAYQKDYRGKHGAFYRAIYLRLAKDYYEEVKDILKSIPKYEVVSFEVILGKEKRRKFLDEMFDKLWGVEK